MQNASFKRACALARLAHVSGNGTDAERATALAKLIAHCDKHSIQLADVIAACGFDLVDFQPEPAPKAAKPDADAKADAQAERIALINEMRAIVAGKYNGPSLAVRTNPKRFATSVYAELLATPKHRTTRDKLTVRDESGLMLIVTRGDTSGGFDPSALNFDAGIFSRLASVGFITATPDGFTLTADGLAHAKAAARKAA